MPILKFSDYTQTKKAFKLPLAAERLLATHPNLFLLDPNYLAATLEPEVLADLEWRFSLPAKLVGGYESKFQSNNSSSMIAVGIFANRSDRFVALNSNGSTIKQSLLSSLDGFRLTKLHQTSGLLPSFSDDYDGDNHHPHHHHLSSLNLSENVVMCSLVCIWVNELSFGMSPKEIETYSS